MMWSTSAADDHWARQNAMQGWNPAGAALSSRLPYGDPPTPPRAMRPLAGEDFPGARRAPGRGAPGAPGAYQAQAQHQQQTQYGGFGGLTAHPFAACDGWDQLKASASARVSTALMAASPTSAASSERGGRGVGGGGDVTCDKCDGAHETERCPHFKQSREQHADSLAHFSGGSAARGSGGAAAAAARQCEAPKTLPQQGYRRFRMPGDGSCLFHSIAFGLKAIGYHSEDGHSVRQRVAKFIAENPEFEITGTPLRDWVNWDSDVSVDNYALRLSRGNLWGGAIEMAACAQIFFVDIVVYEEDYYGGCIRRISDFLADTPQGGPPPRGTILVLYSGRSHYDALQDLSSSGCRGGGGGGYSANHHPGQRSSRAELASPNGGTTEEDDWSSLCTLM